MSRHKGQDASTGGELALGRRQRWVPCLPALSVGPITKEREGVVSVCACDSRPERSVSCGRGALGDQGMERAAAVHRKEIV